MHKLFPSKPSLGEEELAEIRLVFESRWLGLGDFVKKFEGEVEDFLGGGDVIALNSGTSAIHLALEAIGVGKGDEVIVPSLTFCSSVQMITLLGATPVFCEVYTNDLNIDINDVKSKITSKTKAIIPVHYCGISSDLDALMNIKQAYGIRIVEDAAHAFGSTYKNKKIGSFGDITCFSFDPIKNITCGEGGAIVVHDEELAQILRKKRVLGIDKDGWQRHIHKTGQIAYDVTTQGFRYHMSNINAAIGLAQLKKIDSFQSKKREIVELYNERLSKIESISLLKWNLSETFPFAYVIKVDSKYRSDLKKYLKDKGIYVGLNYIPNHLQSFFKTDDKLPVTEKLFGEILTLPLYYELSLDEVEFVIRSVEDFFVKID